MHAGAVDASEQLAQHSLWAGQGVHTPWVLGSFSGISLLLMWTPSAWLP